MKRIRYSLVSAALLGSVATAAAALLPGSVATAAGSSRATGDPVTARLPLKALADGMAFDGSSLWFKTTSNGGLVQVDPTAAIIRTRFKVGTATPSWPATFGPDAWVASNGRTVWVTDQPSNRLLGVDPHTGKVKRRVTLNTPWDVATGFDSLWVPLFDVNQLVRISQSGTVEKRIPIPNPTAVAVGAGSVWVVAHRVGKVTRVDPTTNHVTATIKLPDHGGWTGGGPERAAFGDGAFWTTVDGGVARVDAKTNAVAHIDVPSEGCCTYYVTTGGGSAWIETPTHVYRIAADGSRVTDALHRPSRRNCSLAAKEPCIGALIFAAGSLWVVDNGARQLLRLTP